MRGRAGSSSTLPATRPLLHISELPATLPAHLDSSAAAPPETLVHSAKSTLAKQAQQHQVTGLKGVSDIR